MSKRFKNMLVLSLPIMLKYVFLLIFVDWALFDVEDIVEDLFFFIIILLLLYSNIFKNAFFQNAIYGIYLIYVVLETASYMAVSSNFSSSYMYLLLESNPDELKEFSSSYLNFSIIIFIIILGVLFFVRKRQRLTISTKYYKFIGVLGVFVLIFILKFTGLIESNAYHNIVRGTYGYIDLQNSIKFNENLVKEDVIIHADNEVLVIVLGESTARGHMNLYGYDRETTPFLSSMKDSLYVYNNVISTDVFTLKAIPKIITSLDVNSKKEELVHLVELFNLAGYGTYWLSNQRAISYHDNAISKIASASKWFKFYNHVIDKHTLVMDEALLPDYKKILKAPGKKVVFVRLIGTHFDYNKRYPETFNKFSKNNGHVTKEALIRNQYDNAVLYNDYIVSSLINELKIVKTKSALLYLSDHGENVYDDGTDFFGRSEEVLTKSMFEIPFLLWTSEDFEYPEDFEYNPTKKFMADHTYESIGHVFGILHKDMLVNRSIFSESFKSRKRIVLEGIDFDTYFLHGYKTDSLITNR